MTPIHHANAILTIDLNAIVNNWLLLKDHMGSGRDCAAVVKADAYGLGATKIAPALYNAGCRVFFVAHLDEGIKIRPLLPKASIFVFNGPQQEDATEFQIYNLFPVINSLYQLEIWSKQASQANIPLPCIVHIDTGMSRLGLPEDEITRLCVEPYRLNGLDLRFLMTHLACSDEPEHPLNKIQLERFKKFYTALAAIGISAPVSFVNSSGLFLGTDYLFDLGRPGIALYGSNPTSMQSNPMKPAITLQGKVLQVRKIDSPWSVGYGASYHAVKPTRLATVSIGYANGYPRGSHTGAYAWIDHKRAPLVGRVSMDLLTFDVTKIKKVQPGMMIELIGTHHTLDQLAQAADTVSHDILTSLGPRCYRVYYGEV